MAKENLAYLAADAGQAIAMNRCTMEAYAVKWKPMLNSLKEKFEPLEWRRKQLLQKLSTIPANRFVFHPEPRFWSLSQIVQHLILAEEEVLRQAREQKSDWQRRWIWFGGPGAALVRFVLQRGIRVTAPSRRFVPSRDLPWEDLQQRWDQLGAQLRAELENKSEDALSLKCFVHPIAGEMKITEMLDLLILHFDQWKQVERLASSGATAAL